MKRLPLLALCFAGCAPARPAPIGEESWVDAPHDGSAAPPPPVPRERTIPAGERQRWEHADALGTLVTVGGRGPSEHLGGRYERTVRVNELGAGYGSHAASLPVGAVVAQLHHPRGSDEIAVIFAMVRRVEGWELLVIDDQLAVAARNAAACTRCHLEAPRDGVFGPP